MRVLLQAKMQKETETEETIVFFCDIFIIGSNSIGGGGGRAPWPPPGYAYACAASAKKFSFARKYRTCVTHHFRFDVIHSQCFSENCLRTISFDVKKDFFLYLSTMKSKQYTLQTRMDKFD